MRLIVLSRRNLIKQAVSRQNFARIASMTGKANLIKTEDAEPVELPRFVLDIEAALKYARNSKLEQAVFMDSVRKLTRETGVPIMNVDYNDLLRHHDLTIGRILTFLDVDVNQSLESDEFQKATPNRLQDAISNYDALLKAVQRTEFSSMLEDEDF